VANGADGINRRQRSNSPACLATSRMISEHTAGVASPRLVPAVGSSHQPNIAAVRKSACVGGQSLATTAAKRLLARPACRGGRMMPEQAAKHRTIKKKAKHFAHKPVMEENAADDKCHADRKFQPAPASVSENVPTPVVAVKDEPKTNENVPAPSLPRIVIKIHQGRIVSPSAVPSSSVSSVGVMKQTSKCHSSGTVDSQESKLTAAVTQRSEKSDRLNVGPVPRPAKAISGNRPNPKGASHSTSSKVLADRNSNVAYFDSDQLQNSGSFDKLSLDCCMKLYGQLNQQQKTSQQSVPENAAKLSKHADMKKRSVDRMKQTACVSEHSAKMQAVGSSGNLVKVLTSRSPPNCTVQLNRIKAVNDLSVSVRQSSGDNSSQVKSSVRERLSSGRERQLGGNVYDFGASGDDNTANDNCSVTLTRRSHAARGDAPIQQTDIPSATETVPGSPLSLSKRQIFCKRSHTPMDSDTSRSGLPKKSRSVETASRSSSSENSHADLLSSLLSSSVNDTYKSTAVKKSDRVLSTGDMRHSESRTDDGNRGFEVHTTTEIRNSKNAALGLANGPASDAECSRSSTGRKRCNPTVDSDSISSSNVSKSKKSRNSRLPGEVSVQSTVELLASDIADEVSDANPAFCLPSLTTPTNADAAVCRNATAPELSSDSELQSSEADWISPSCSPGTGQTVESSALPLRLKIRRLADISPVKEIYNVIGQPVRSDSTPTAQCSMYQP